MSQPLPIDTAPKDRRILLYLPEEGAWAATWWFGSWSVIDGGWVIHAPLTVGGKQLHLSDLPRQPTYWLPSPENPT